MRCLSFKAILEMKMVELYSSSFPFWRWWKCSRPKVLPFDSRKDSNRQKSHSQNICDLSSQHSGFHDLLAYWIEKETHAVFQKGKKFYTLRLHLIAHLAISSTAKVTVLVSEWTQYIKLNLLDVIAASELANRVQTHSALASHCGLDLSQAGLLTYLI